VLENLYTDSSFILGTLSKEINADVGARIILAYFLTNRAEYEQNTASHQVVWVRDPSYRSCRMSTS